MNDQSNILDGEFVLEAEWAKANRITPRTAARYRQQGLPWADFGGKVWIYVPGSREWLAKRISASKSEAEWRCHKVKRPAKDGGPSTKIGRKLRSQRSATLTDPAPARQATSVIATIDLRAASRERRWLR